MTGMACFWGVVGEMGVEAVRGVAAFVIGVGSGFLAGLICG